MDTYHYICVLSHSDTYHNCVKCHKALCNRPDYSTFVNESHTGYSEDHPKAASICKSCSGSKKRQASISTFFNKCLYFLLSHNAKLLIYRSLQSLYMSIFDLYISIFVLKSKYGHLQTL